MENNQGDQHLIDELYRMQTELSEMKNKNDTLNEMLSALDNSHQGMVQRHKEIFSEMKKEREELVGVLNNLVEANPGDSTWNYPAAFDAAISLLNRINKTTNG